MLKRKLTNNSLILFTTRYPYIYKNQLTKRRVLLIAIGIWTLSIALPCIYFKVGYVTYAFIFANTAIILTIAIICFMYYLMYRALKTRARSETPVAIVVKNLEDENRSHDHNNIEQNGKYHHQNDTEETSPESYHNTAPTCHQQRNSAGKTVPESYSQNLVNHEENIANESSQDCCQSINVVTRNVQMKHENVTPENPSQIRVKLEQGITKRFLVVLIALLLCYGPSTILIYAMTFCTSCSCTTLHWLRDLQFLFVIANSSVNFFAYALRSSRFRKTFAKILKLKSREHSLGCPARMADSSTDIMNI